MHLSVCLCLSIPKSICTCPLVGLPLSIRLSAPDNLSACMWICMQICLYGYVYLVCICVCCLTVLVSQHLAFCLSMHVIYPCKYMSVWMCMYMCFCVCMFVMCVCMCICTYLSVCMCLLASVSLNARVHLCAYLCGCAYNKKTKAETRVKENKICFI